MKEYHFSGSLIEKSYLIGLRAGDVSGRKRHFLVGVHTTTTHPAQIKMFQEAFGKYSPIMMYRQIHRNQLQNRIYCDLHESFDFLVKKPNKVPKWILNNTDCFYGFLAGYMDSEGCWSITKSNKNHISFRFQIWTMDKIIVEQINAKLRELGFNSNFCIRCVKGKTAPYGKYKNNLYGVVINMRLHVIKLANTLLSFSRHQEKIQKMSLILDSINSKWDEIKDDVLELRKNIKESRLTRVESTQQLN